MKLLALAAAGGVALACASGGSAPELDAAPVVVSDGRLAMGTVLEISLVGRAGAEAEARAEIDSAFEDTAELESQLSSWDPDSDVSRLNRDGHREPQRVSGDVSALLSQSILYSRFTAGAFDVSVGPLVDLWAAAARSGVAPTAEEIARVRERVGIEHLRVYGDGRVGFAREGVALNLGGVAKGFALDRLVPRIRAHGFQNALLSFGQSSTWALGAPPGADGWRLLVRGPAQPVLGVLTLRDQALSVSESLGEFSRIGGVEYGHILDPRTGIPLSRRRQAVVVAKNAALAEAFSKALLIAGEQAGIALVEAQPRCEGMLADEDGTLTTTSGWQAAVRFERLESAGGPESKPGTQVR